MIPNPVEVVVAINLTAVCPSLALLPATEPPHGTIWVVLERRQASQVVRRAVVIGFQFHSLLIFLTRLPPESISFSATLGLGLFQKRKAPVTQRLVIVGVDLEKIGRAS